MEESCIPSNIQWITHFLTNPKITNQNTIGSGICSVKAWTTIIWYFCRLVYPREISQATMMAGSSRWQSAVIGGNGAWRSLMRTMNPKSNRTCLYRRSDRGPVLRFHKPNATVCVIKWIWQIRKRWSLHKTNNIVNINYIHTYRELSYSQNDLITAARARLSLGLDTVVAGRVTV